MARVLLLIGAQLCMAPRPRKEAAALAAAGHDVAIAGFALTEEGRELDRALSRDAPFRFLVIRDFTSPQLAERLRCSVARLRRRGASELAGLTGRRFPAELGFDTAAMTALARSFRADLTIAHCEAGLHAIRCLEKEGCRVGVDFEDFFSEDLPPAQRRHRPVKLLRDLERFALQRAGYRLATSHAMAKALAEFASAPERPPAVVPNVFPFCEAPPFREPGPEEPLRLVWFSQTVGTERGLRHAIAALNGIDSPVELTILGRCTPQVREELMAATSPSLASRVRLIPPVEPGELPAELARHDIGLCLEDPSIPSRDLTITNKMFQYMQAGLALLATDTKGQREVLAQEPAAGRIVPPGDSEALREAVRSWLVDSPSLLSARRAAREAFEARWNWEAFAPVVVQEARKALEAPLP